MSKKPTILLTNDDGVNAVGIRHVWEALNPLANLVVVAPKTQKSSTSLCLTVRDPLQVEQYNWGEGSQIWSVSGMPADCVKMALSVILDEEPDMIISGINEGSNAGRNALYSGTVAAAIEGAFRGIPSLAISSVCSPRPLFESAAQLLPQLMEHLLEHPLGTGTLLNVNVPSIPLSQLKGIRLAKQGQTYLVEDPDRRVCPGGNPYYWLGGQLSSHQDTEDSDIELLKSGFATAVPLHISDLTDHKERLAREESFAKMTQNLSSI